MVEVGKALEYEKGPESADLGGARPSKNGPQCQFPINIMIYWGKK